MRRKERTREAETGEGGVRSDCHNTSKLECSLLASHIFYTNRNSNLVFCWTIVFAGACKEKLGTVQGQ